MSPTKTKKLKTSRNFNEKLEAFLYIPFDNKRPTWQRVALCALFVIPWLLLGWIYFMGGSSKTTTRVLDTVSGVVETQVDNFNKQDEKIKNRVEELNKEVSGLRKKVTDTDGKISNIIDKINSASTESELDSIRDELRRLNQ